MIIVIKKKGEGFMAQKYSARREQIYEYLATHKNHPQAEQVYLALKKTSPSLSLATVYRNLAGFVSEGRAIALPGANHTVHFDANIAPHYHFSCYNCGQLYDVDYPVLEPNWELLHSVGEATRHELIFYGICNQCKNKNLESEEC